MPEGLRRRHPPATGAAMQMPEGLRRRPSGTSRLLAPHASGPHRGAHERAQRERVLEQHLVPLGDPRRLMLIYLMTRITKYQPASTATGAHVVVRPRSLQNR